MLNLKTVALATVLTLSIGGTAFAAGSAFDALGSANTVSIQTVGGADAFNVMNGNGSELVDLDSLKARIQGNPRLLSQLESYGASVDDVVGISGSDETDVTIYVQG